MEQILVQIGESLQKGDLEEVVSSCNEALNRKINASDILAAMLNGMGVIGDKFKHNEVFVPEVLIAARAMNGGLNIIKPYLIDEGAKSLGKVVIGTVKGDLHDIGKNIVSMMMTGSGFEVIDLGVNVTAEKFVEALEVNKPDILCMSALLTTTMINMKEVINAIEEKGLREQVKIMVGGAPLSDRFAQDIGADMFAPDASTASEEAKKFMM
ncbi:MAG: corrinoid protein [Dethiosulfatibacter sp.]|nr:corrinoid protein [Dethiosulfatibacter sp.]